MRFIERNNDGEFSLTEDLVDNTPRYAILSHRWEAEEITFKEMMDGTGRNKAGYKKIRFCGEQAGRDHIRYFWVDTCCIDKTNSTELSEAINSMFRWYRGAAKCYVYLSDVPGSISSIASDSYLLPWEPAFRESKWFTRGWTLQELLPPTSVEFFSRYNKRLGDKRTLEQHIYEVTGIPISALRGASLSQFGVDERLSWAENRQTTRGEDKAYSLLGMFGIYVPLIYGEGRDRAFKRLKKEIQNEIKESEQHLPEPHNQSRIQNLSITNPREDKKQIEETKPNNQSCIQDLSITDPREDKKRIEEMKGGLLRDSYQWIFEHPDFHKWRNDKQAGVLWITGDPGKGKTMLLCGIIDKISALKKLKNKDETSLLSYFFCQATDNRINSAIAVLRGLIYLLIDQQPSLIKYVQEKYSHAGKALFEDINAWASLSEIFTSILQDVDLNKPFLIIDALDECVADLPKLLKFIVHNSGMSPRIKWVISSRNRPDIAEQLKRAMQKTIICLELNSESVSPAIDTYIDLKVDSLAKKKNYNKDTRDAVQRHLSSNANGTFFWVALVCQQLASFSGHTVEQMFTAFPPGLDALYRQMINQICNSNNSNLCKSVLAVRVVSSATTPRCNRSATAVVWFKEPVVQCSGRGVKPRCVWWKGVEPQFAPRFKG